MSKKDWRIDFSRTIQDLALLYTQNHLHAKAENDDQVNWRLTSRQSAISLEKPKNTHTCLKNRWKPRWARNDVHVRLLPAIQK